MGRKILFFNGWGMDEAALMPLQEGIILNYPYILPEDVDLKKGDWVAIGWSFGAYYLNKFVDQQPAIKFKEIIAINGHGAMLGKYGIREKMLDLTLKNLTPESLKAFYKNMALPEGKENKTRDFMAIKEELSYFAEHYQPIANHFTKAIIATEDRIVPSKAMLKYFTEQQVPVTCIEAPHYPFQQLDTWEKIGEL